MKPQQSFGSLIRIVSVLAAAWFVAACGSSVVPIGDQNAASGGIAAQGDASSSHTGGSASHVGGSSSTGGTNPGLGGTAVGLGGDPNTGGTVAEAGGTSNGLGGTHPTGGVTSSGTGGGSSAGGASNTGGSGTSTCSYNGSTLAVGQQITMSDGCNTCYCEATSPPYLLCTTKQCLNTGGATNAGGSSNGGATNAGGADAGTGTSTGTAATCGNSVCDASQRCCGPTECGHCIPAASGQACPAVCTSSSCGPSGAPCASNEICLELEISVASMGTITSSSCVTNPCGTQTLDCSCAGTICQDADATTACGQAYPTQGTLLCTGGGKCAAPDTPIATPEGNVPIADLKPGDLVYSSDNGAMVAVPLLGVTRRPVSHHRVVQVRTQKGAVLNISAPHPTADGRTFGDLRVGGTLDGDTIVARELVPYPFAYTYDILPASSTGTYVAGGLLIGSTLSGTIDSLR